jgi:hypothetical protein
MLAGAALLLAGGLPGRTAAEPPPGRDGAAAVVRSSAPLSEPSTQARARRNGAKAESHPGPFTLEPGEESEPYTISFQNTGRSTWTTRDGYHLRNVTTGSRFPLGPEFPPGCDGLPRLQVCSWTITATASNEPGPRKFTFRYRLYRDQKPFGDTIKVQFKVKR